jgi:hypothetical protein
MKESKFNFKFEISNFCANVKVKSTSLRTAVRQLANTLTVRELANTLTVREFKKQILRVSFKFKLSNVTIGDNFKSQCFKRDLQNSLFRIFCQHDNTLTIDYKKKKTDFR